MSVLDGLAAYLEENDSLAELEAFLQRHCRAVPTEGGEHSHEAFAAYKGYEELVHGILADFVEQSRRNLHLVGLGGDQASAEGVVAALRDERATLRPDLPGQRLRALVAIDSYEEFASEARRLHAGSQLAGSVGSLGCEGIHAASASEDSRCHWKKRRLSVEGPECQDAVGKTLIHWEASHAAIRSQLRAT